MEGCEEMVSELDVSVVMPTYNEGERIEENLGKIDSIAQRTGLEYEVIVVDDGSFDDTSKNAMRYANRNGHVRICSHSRNSGKGRAVRTGFQQARSNAIVFVDGDLDVEWASAELERCCFAASCVRLCRIHGLWHARRCLDGTSVRGVGDQAYG